MSVLAIEGLNQKYGGSQILWDVRLDVAAGSRTCLMGRNGMGKTTLLKCIMGLLAPHSGTVAFDGVELTRMPAEARARSRAAAAARPTGRRRAAAASA